MLGSRSGFVDKIKKKCSSADITHCIIHHDVLAERTIRVELRNLLNSVIKIVNFIICGPEFSSISLTSAKLAVMQILDFSNYARQ